MIWVNYLTEPGKQPHPYCSEFNSDLQSRLHLGMESPVTYFSSSLSLSILCNIHMWWGWLYLGCFNNCIQLHHCLIFKMIEYRKSKIIKSAEFLFGSTSPLILWSSFPPSHIQSLFVTLIPKSPSAVTLIPSDRAPGPKWTFPTLSPCTPFMFPIS